MELTNELIARIDRFDLRARLIVEGFMIGLHKSPYHGFSVEFSDHRQYNPGDSIRHIDWKLFARSNRYYIKRFEEETNLRMWLLIDHSGSMGYSSGEWSKLKYTQALASALAYLMITQNDAVGLMTFADQITGTLEPRSLRSYLNLLFSQIQGLVPGNTTRTAAVLHHLAERVNKRGMVVLISDLLDDPEEILSGLKHFRYRNHEVILFHIRDPRELDFDFKREAQFVDAETGEKITINPWQIRSEYLSEYQEFSHFLRDNCLRHQIDYNPIDTSTPFQEALLQYLIKRSRLG